jgi:ATP-dependent HslUV protease ATP-binding subunit HslU
VAEIAFEVNRTTQNIGARRLHTILERVVEEVSFDAPDLPDKHVRVDGAYVRKRLDSILQKEDLSRYIL